MLNSLVGAVYTFGFILMWAGRGALGSSGGGQACGGVGLVVVHPGRLRQHSGGCKLCALVVIPPGWQPPSTSLQVPPAVPQLQAEERGSSALVSGREGRARLAGEVGLSGLPGRPCWPALGCPITSHLCLPPVIPAGAR